MKEVPAVLNMFMLLAVTGQELLNNVTILVTFVVLVIGVLSALQKKFDRDVAIARENSVGLVRMEKMDQENMRRDLDIKALVEARLRSEILDKNTGDRIGVFEKNIDERMRKLEVDYITALKELASRSPYQNRGLMSRGYPQEDM